MKELAEQKRNERENTMALLARNRDKERQKVLQSDEDDAMIFHPFLVGMNKDNVFAPLQILGQVDLGFLSQKGDCAPAMLSFVQTAEEESAQNTAKKEKAQG